MGKEHSGGEKLRFFSIICTFCVVAVLGGCTTITLPENQQAKTSKINPDDPKFSGKALVTGFVGLSNFGLFNITRRCDQGHITLLNEKTSKYNYLSYSTDKVFAAGIEEIAFLAIDPGTYYVTHVACSGAKVIEYHLRQEYKNASLRKSVPHFTIDKKEVVSLGLFEIYEEKSLSLNMSIGTLQIKAVEEIDEKLRAINPVLADRLTVRLPNYKLIDGAFKTN